jgi:benzoyl-CoA reductase/2-hydroxyglutaryl-CoA dehydratase subunit BcrC/BadD/HgdB
MLVRNSYYFAGDLDIWSRQLAALQQETAKRAALCQPGTRPRILLAGSPVFFPNYKVPFLIEDAGLSIEDCIDAATIMQEELLRPEALRSMRHALHVIADSSYRHEASPAFVLNDALMDAVSAKIRGGRVEGVIFHILKGQIEYDFELERMTKMFEYYDIPVFRLETDYQQQDVEQLRIRLEAFAEMLGQRNQERVRIAQ